MINKANDAFRTISEVSVELEVPPHVLRFWCEVRRNDQGDEPDAERGHPEADHGAERG